MSRIFSLLAIALVLVPVSICSQDSTNGKIKGVVTYFFNENFGDRADVGAYVYLVSGSVDVSSDLIVARAPDNSMNLAVFGQPGVNRRIPFVSVTRVDGAGTFELSDVQPGTFTVAIQSQHSNGRSYRDNPHRWSFIHIEVKANGTSDASVSFPQSDY
jgi:hypothetical protein